jgi:hypothetical protein
VGAGLLACCARWWVLLGGLLRILRNVRFHPNLPAFSTATKNYKYLGLVLAFLLPSFQNYPHQSLTSIRRYMDCNAPGSKRALESDSSEEVEEPARKRLDSNTTISSTLQAS